MDWSMAHKSREQSTSSTPDTLTGNAYQTSAHYLNNHRAHKKVDTDAGQCAIFKFDSSSDDNDRPEKIKIKREIEETSEQNLDMLEEDQVVRDNGEQIFQTQVGNKIKQEIPEYLKENEGVRIKEEVQESYEHHGQFWTEQESESSAGLFENALKFNVLEEHNYFYAGGDRPEDVAHVQNCASENCDPGCATDAQEVRQDAQSGEGNVSYECDKCKQMFRNEKVFQKHVHFQYCRMRLPCKYCGVVFEYKRNLEDHLKTCEEKLRVVDRKECTVCKRLFKTVNLLRRHERSCECELRLKCQCCGLVCKNLQGFTNHLRKCYVTDSQGYSKYYDCSICNKIFEQISEFQKHKKTHVPRPRVCKFKFKCKFCGQKFAKKSVLIKHEESHPPAMPLHTLPYSCGRCNEEFSTVDSLKRHEVVHSGVKPFKCEICHVGFSYQTSLAKHRCAKGDGALSTKPLCGHCNKEFSTLDSLKRHEFVHTGVKPFKCEYCDVGFLYKASFAKHHCATADAALKSRSVGPNCTVDTKPDVQQMVDAVGIRSEDATINVPSHASVKRESDCTIDTELDAHGPVDAGEIQTEDYTVTITGIVPNCASVNVKCEPDCTTDAELDAHLPVYAGGFCPGPEDGPSITPNCPSVKCEFESVTDAKPDAVRRSKARKRLKRKVVHECDKCTQTFTNKSLFKKHKRLHKRKRSPCTYCGNVYNSAIELEGHLKICEEKVRIVVRKECKVCEKRFDTGYFLKKHENSFECEMRWRCRSCSLGCKAHDEFTNHMRKCNNGHGYLKYYQCSVCDHVFDDSKDFETHKKSHRLRPAAYQFKCKFCGQGFAKKSFAVEHEQSHTSAKPYQCRNPYCSQEFSSSGALKRHEFVHSGLKPFRCLFCYEGFMFKSRLDKHQCPIEDDGALKCRFCDRAFIKERSLKKHEKEHELKNGKVNDQSGTSHSLTLQDQQEESEDEELDVMSPFTPLLKPVGDAYETFDTSPLVLRGERENGRIAKQSEPAVPQEQGKINEQTEIAPAAPQEQSEEHICRHCNKIFKSAANLSRHEATHRGKKPYACPYCDETFSFKKHFQRHKARKHIGPNPYKCRHCKKGFDKKHKVVRHERTHTGEKPYPCRFCDKAFTTASQRASHQRTHTGKTYPCRFCDTVLSSLPSRWGHEQAHKGTRTYSCRYCDKTFRHSGALWSHERKHTGERPYACDYCDKAFLTKHTKELHERIHTGFKPHQCNFCDKSFARNDHLKYHIRIHTGEKPLKCQYCDKCFATRSQVFYHERVHTKETTP